MTARGRAFRTRCARRRVARRAAAACAAWTLAGPGAAFGHEPLWGQTPVTFGAGVLHGEVLGRYLDAGDATAPDGERMRTSEVATMLDWGMHPDVNLQLMVPFAWMEMEEFHQGAHHTQSTSGLGDMRLRAKYRFFARFAPRFKEQHGLLMGVKFPTGDDDAMVDMHGVRQDPRDQLGSGKFGTLLGYAYDRTDLTRALWVSALWRHDLGSGFRLGDAVELNGAAGYWFVRPNVAEDFGLHVAAGLYSELAAADHRDDGQPVAGSAQVFGVHLTPIVTKGRTQARVGVFVPLARSGRESLTDFPVELRGGIESFF